MKSRTRSSIHDVLVGVAAGVLLGHAFAGCTDDEWVYRPFPVDDAGKVPDVGDAPSPVDGSTLDATVRKDAASDGLIADTSAPDGAPSDASVETDASASDGMDTDASTADASLDVPTVSDATSDATSLDVPGVDVVADVPRADAPTVDAVTPDAGPTVLTLRAGGFTTTGAEPQRVGTLRLVEHGFEFGDRACVGSICLTGGFSQ